MKNKISFACIAFSAALLTPALNAFDGKMNVTITDAKNPERSRSLVLYTSGEKMRVEPVAVSDSTDQKKTPPVLIVDNSKHMVSTLMLDKKTYSQRPTSGAIASRVGLTATDVEYKATGNKEKIAGIDAEQYTASENDGVYHELWVTKQLGKFLVGTPGEGGAWETGGLIAQGAWSRFAYSQDFFVLRAVVSSYKGGTEQYRFEVTKVEAGPQSDSLFKVPADFKKVEPGDMKKKDHKKTESKDHDAKAHETESTMD